MKIFLSLLGFVAMLGGLKIGFDIVDEGHLVVGLAAGAAVVVAGLAVMVEQMNAD